MLVLFCITTNLHSLKILTNNRIREPHPQSHVTHWPFGHVTTHRRYISTFVRPMDLKLSRILVILWLLRYRFAQKEIGWSKIVSNSEEIRLHHCLCESSGYKTGRSNHQRVFSRKGILENFAKLTEKDLCPSPTRIFYRQFYKIFENTFFTKTTPGDCFWWRGLMVKNFNSVLLIFLNSQLYHAPPEWWLLFWCNEEHFLIKKTWLNFK